MFLVEVFKGTENPTGRFEGPFLSAEEALRDCEEKEGEDWLQFEEMPVFEEENGIFRFAD